MAEKFVFVLGYMSNYLLFVCVTWWLLQSHKGTSDETAEETLLGSDLSFITLLSNI